MLKYLLFLLVLGQFFLAKAQTIPVYKFGSITGLPVNNGLYTTSSCDQNGNVYCGGHYRDTLDVDPGPAIDIRMSVGVEDLILSSFDKYGNLRWCLTGGDTQKDKITRVKTDVDGTILVMGQAVGLVDFDPGPAIVYANGSTGAFLARYDTTGNLIWVYSVFNNIYSLYPEIGGDFTTDSSKNIYFSTTFFGIVDFNLGAGVDTVDATSLGGDIAIVKYDSAMNFIWVKHMIGASSGGEIANCIDIDPSGNVVFTGYLAANNTVDFDAGVGYQPLVATGYHYMFLAK